jgi:tyrosyl-tRNA synthetase
MEKAELSRIQLHIMQRYDFYHLFKSTAAVLQCGGDDSGRTFCLGRSSYGETAKMLRMRSHSAHREAKIFKTLGAVGGS